ncbi:MAG TPA: gamma-glutamyl-gamma-aminobutyrate hydrolase family protein [Candidatus Nitrosocosmicus sp.]|nr:gamma-glutamyl-gamma-aminobutyrate hydrolase family protein [Candidatus Nitrosocosmicus sp.]
MREKTGKPLIGLTTYKRERGAYCVVVTEYVYSVFAAGGIPVMIPNIDDESDYDYYIDMLDGILFTGGVDINPRCYGEQPLREVNGIATYKDQYELGLFKKAYEKVMPIFGICRGNQLINVALGGKLYQDINRQLPDSFGHYPTDTPEDELYHSVKLVEGSKLHGIMEKDELYVNSFHHQAIKTLGSNLVVTAVSKDNIIEAVESTEDRYLLGVQWHPECLTRRYPIFLNLFKRFVQEAAEYKYSKASEALKK